MFLYCTSGSFWTKTTRMLEPGTCSSINMPYHYFRKHIIHTDYLLMVTDCRIHHCQVVTVYKSQMATGSCQSTTQTTIQNGNTDMNNNDNDSSNNNHLCLLYRKKHVNLHPSKELQDSVAANFLPAWTCKIENRLTSVNKHYAEITWQYTKIIRKTVTFLRRNTGTHDCEMRLATSAAICLCRIDAEVPIPCNNSQSFLILCWTLKQKRCIHFLHFMK